MPRSLHRSARWKRSTQLRREADLRTQHQHRSAAREHFAPRAAGTPRSCRCRSRHRAGRRPACPVAPITACQRVLLCGVQRGTGAARQHLRACGRAGHRGQIAAVRDAAVQRAAARQPGKPGSSSCALRREGQPASGSPQQRAAAAARAATGRWPALPRARRRRRPHDLPRRSASCARRAAASACAAAKTSPIGWW